MRLNAIIFGSLLALSCFASATEDEKTKERRDSLGLQIIKVDSINNINFDDKGKGKVKMDDTLVFDDDEAPKGNKNGFVLNKKGTEEQKCLTKIVRSVNDNFALDEPTIQLPEAAISLPFEAFPNPAIVSQGINLILPYPANWIIEVIGLNGQRLPQITAINETLVSLEILGSGLYYIKAVEGNTTLYKRLIVK